MGESHLMMYFMTQRCRWRIPWQAVNTAHLPDSADFLRPLETVGPVFRGYTGSILYLGLRDGYTGVYIDKNASSCAYIIP